MDAQRNRGSLMLLRGSAVELLARGRLAPIDAAAITYIDPEDLGIREEMVDALAEEVFRGLPWVASIYDLPNGRIGTLVLPTPGSRLLADKQALVQSVISAVRMAGRIGARAVSLTGMIPSAVGDAREITDSVPVRVTTGHATVVAAVGLTFHHLCESLGRPLGGERLGILGLGAIGTAVLGYLFDSGLVPAEIELCDLMSKAAHLEASQERLRSTYCFQGPVRIRTSRGSAPEEFYRCGIIFGATSVPGVLSIPRLRPGTIVIDESGPHCFSVADALARFRTTGDTIVTEAGVLRAPEPLGRTYFFPRQPTQLDASLEALVKSQPADHITGCVLSALLAATEPEITCDVGDVGKKACARNARWLREHGFQSAAVHCEGVPYDLADVEQFMTRFRTGDLPPMREVR